MDTSKLILLDAHTANEDSLEVLANIENLTFINAEHFDLNGLKWAFYKD